MRRFRPRLHTGVPRNGVNPNKHIFARRQSHLPGFWLSRIIKRGPLSLSLSPPYSRPFPRRNISRSVSISLCLSVISSNSPEPFRTSYTVTLFPQCDFSYPLEEKSEFSFGSKSRIFSNLFNNNNNNKYRGSRVSLYFVKRMQQELFLSWKE